MSSSQSQTRVVVEQLNHIYPKGKQALKNISLDIGIGLFGLLGANGAGKSTLMRILSTLLAPSGGSVSVAGYDLARERFEARRQVGYLPQEFGVWPSYTVSQSLHLFASLSGIENDHERKKK